MSAESPQLRIDRFIKVFLSSVAPYAPGVPDEMRDGPDDREGWCAWKPVASPVTQDMMQELEDSIGVPLPPLFKAYLTNKCLLMTDFGMLSLPEMRPDEPLEEFQGYLGLYQPGSYWRTQKLLPFGEDGDATGPICFDISQPTVDGDYPVVFVDRERTRQPGYRGEKRWDSFAQMLDAVEEHLQEEADA